ncbi:MAG: hypothetical protein UH542_06115 [Bacteroidales bacterium]|nr:hypothetical protein [Bacteroidales bacterium]
MSNKKEIYVCYEENSPKLAIENGPIDEMVVVATKNDAILWANNRLGSAYSDFFKPTCELDEIEFDNALRKGENAELTLYFNGDECSKSWYSLVVERFTVDSFKSTDAERCGFSPKIGDDVRRRLEETTADMRKSERFAEAFVDLFETDDEISRRRGYYMAKAILDGNIDDLLIAICGYSTQSLLNIAERGTPYPEN